MLGTGIRERSPEPGGTPPATFEPQWEPYFAQEPDFLHWTDITASAGAEPAVLHALADAS